MLYLKNGCSLIAFGGSGQKLYILHDSISERYYHSYYLVVDDCKFFKFVSNNKDEAFNKAKVAFNNILDILKNNNTIDNNIIFEPLDIA